MPQVRRRFAFAVRLAAALASLALGLGVLAGETRVAEADPVHVDAPAVPGFADVVSKVTPAVVSVRAVGEASPDGDEPGFSFRDPDALPGSRAFGRLFRGFMEGHESRKHRVADPEGDSSYPIAQGSGFFVSADGYVVTSSHVVEDASGFTVIAANGTRYDARLIGSDRRTDLAVLKVDAKQPFTYVAFADDAKVRVGDWVVTVGNPSGLGATVAAGIVSARNSDTGASLPDDFLQIDAAAVRGGSGSPAFDLNGEVIGVETALFAPSFGNGGIAFAVPATTARKIVDQLIAKGSVERGWIGLEVQSVTADMAESLGLGTDRGAIVTRAGQDGPAGKAGIAAGDVIVSVNGQAISDARALAGAITSLAPGSSAELGIWRNGNRKTVSVDVSALPTEPDESKPSAPSEPAGSAPDFGMKLLPSDSGKGLLVTSVQPGSQAEDKGIQPGDIILSVNNRPLGAPDDLKKALQEALGLHRHAVLLQVQSESRMRFVALALAG